MRTRDLVVECRFRGLELKGKLLQGSEVYQTKGLHAFPEDSRGYPHPLPHSSLRAKDERKHSRVNTE